MQRGFFACGAACLCLLTVVGCNQGPKLVKVSGQVLIDGEPVKGGFIQVVPKEERAATGKIGEDGRFSLTTYQEEDGVVLGTHDVAVMATRQLSPTRTEHLVPPKYANPATSGVTTTIDGPTDNLKIELSWEGGKPYIEEIITGGDVLPLGSDEKTE
jgi:hypothetical protein